MKPDSAGVTKASLIKWDKFESEPSTNFLFNFKLDDDFSDLKILCRGPDDSFKIIKSHKLLMLISSLYFRGQLVEDASPEPVIYLENIEFDDLASILTFIYEGSVMILERRLDRFIELARELKVRGLYEEKEELESTDDATFMPVDDPNDVDTNDFYDDTAHLVVNADAIKDDEEIAVAEDNQGRQKKRDKVSEVRPLKKQTKEKKSAQEATSGIENTGEKKKGIRKKKEKGADSTDGTNQEQKKEKPKPKNSKVEVTKGGQTDEKKSKSAKKDDKAEEKNGGYTATDNGGKKEGKPKKKNTKAEPGDARGGQKEEQGGEKKLKGGKKEKKNEGTVADNEGPKEEKKKKTTKKEKEKEVVESGGQTEEKKENHSEPSVDNKGSDASVVGKAAEKSNQEAKKNFPCPECPKVFSISRQLKDHLAVHRGENTCQYCQKVFARPYTLVTHIARVHKNNIGNDASNVASDASNAGSNASNVGNNANNVAGDANKENKKNVNNDDEASSSDEYLNQSDFFDI